MKSLKKSQKILNQLKNFVYQPDTFIKYIAKESYLSKKRLLSPLTITWDLVNYCNLNCYFCSAGMGHKKYNKNCKFNTASYKDIIKFIDSCNSLYITLRGGEPSLHPEFLEILKHFTSHPGFIELVTNGTKVDETAAAILATYDQNRLRVKISLDSDNLLINDAQRGNGSFNYAIKAIENLQNYKIKNIRVQMVATPGTIESIFSLYKYIHKYSVNSFGLTILTPSGDSKDIEAKMYDDRIFDEISNCLDYYSKEKKIQIEKCHVGYTENFKFDNNSFDREKAEMLFKIKCVAGNIKLNIDSDGTIYPCDFLKFPDFKCGKVTDNLEEVWNSDILISLYKMTRNDKEECSKCKNSVCTTGCMGFAYEKYHSIYRKDPNCKIG